jgi:hypothetical protein
MNYHSIWLLVYLTHSVTVQWAAKAGGHELKGIFIHAVFACRIFAHQVIFRIGLIGFQMADIHELRLPLLALIDYRGKFYFRSCTLLN